MSTIYDKNQDKVISHSCFCLLGFQNAVSLFGMLFNDHQFREMSLQMTAADLFILI